MQAAGSAMRPAMLTPTAVTRLQHALLAWFEGHQRRLPWRAGPGQRPDPYAVWISEVMLQQTQVATALPYFERWMARFPTVAVLAEAPLDEVLALWQGLGYYGRARNLHRAAIQIVAEQEGRLPEDPAALRQLPGIGAYAAGAIASIAFGRPAPAVDGNARRVLARLGAIEGDPARPPAAEAIRDLAEALVQVPEPGQLNQALMELGARICTPRNPACPGCPVAADCRARQTGRERELPAASPRTRQRAEHAYAFALYRGKTLAAPWDAPPPAGAAEGEGPWPSAEARMNGNGERLWLVGRRPPQGLLGGLWEFPMLAAPPGEDPQALLRQAFGLELRGAVLLEPLLHVFSHLRLTAQPVLGVVDVEPADPAGRYAAWRWASTAELEGRTLATSALMDKLLARAREERRAGA